MLMVILFCIVFWFWLGGWESYLFIVYPTLALFSQVLALETCATISSFVVFS